MVKVLSEKGADPHFSSVTDIDTKETETVLEVATRWNHMDIVEYLLQ